MMLLALMVPSVLSISGDTGASVPGGVLSRKSYEISGLREILYHTSRNQNIILSDEMLSVITWAGSAGSNTGVDGASMRPQT